VIFLFLNYCQTDNQKQNPIRIYDFYYGKNYIQIIGIGKIKESSLNFEKNLQECIKEAKIHADSKWLGITKKYIESQRLWYDRLKNNYYSLWKTCLEEAKIQNVAPIYPNKCKIVVHYNCDPQDW
jgi:hypothetical protein